VDGHALTPLAFLGLPQGTKDILRALSRYRGTNSQVSFSLRIEAGRCPKVDPAETACMKGVATMDLTTLVLMLVSFIGGLLTAMNILAPRPYR
jgi:hypothetical protein